MQWMSLGLVVVLGGATVLTQSPPVHDGKADHRPPRRSRCDVVARLDDPLPAGDRPSDVPVPAIVAAGYAWAALLAALGLTNLIITLHFDFVTWA